MEQTTPDIQPPTLQTPEYRPHPFASLQRLPQTTPWVSYLLFGICIAVFVCYKIPSHPLGDPPQPARAIWVYGQYWHLITDAFIHLEPFHIAFNIYALYLLGPLVERQMGWFFFILFILASDFVSSSFQLAGGISGIGISGIIYAIIGYMLLTRRRYLEIAMMMHDGNVKLFVGWLFICIAISWLGILPIGNLAHFSGFIFGIAIGAIVVNRRRFLWAPIALAMFALSFIPPLWAPWTDNFLLYKGYAAAQRQNLDEALAYCNRIITRSPNFALAYYLRGQIYVNQGEPQKGQAEFDTAARLDPDLIKLQSNNSKKDAQ